MTPDEQLDEWLKGNPIHNDDRCCPDFSCCRGKDKIAPLATRKRFVQARKDGDEETYRRMLFMFLGEATSDEGVDKEVYLAGDIPPPIKLN